MMRHGCNIWLLLLAAALCAPALQAERYGGEFLDIPVGAKAYGMGGAFGPVADDVSAIYWNPAGIVGSRAAARDSGGERGAADLGRSPMVMVTHTELFGSLAHHDFIGFTCPVSGRVSVGVAWIRLGVDDIPRFSHTVGTPPQGSFGDNENAFYVSGATIRRFRLFRAPVDVSGGGSVKVIYNKLDDKQATGIGTDLGLLLDYRHDGPLRRVCGRWNWNELKMSLTVRDIGGTVISWNTVRQHADIKHATYQFGAAYVAHFDRLKADATVSYEVTSESLMKDRYGAELRYRPLHGIVAAMRAGYDGQGMIVGAGIGVWRLQIDYGFNKHELGNSHRVSASFRL